MVEKRILVVGSGFAGATFARLAVEGSAKVDVVDRRPHIGGNSHTIRLKIARAWIYYPNMHKWQRMKKLSS